LGSKECNYSNGHFKIFHFSAAYKANVEVVITVIMLAICCLTSASHGFAPGKKHPIMVAPTIPNWNKITIFMRFMT
jgi:isochorismate hydrolase